MQPKEFCLVLLLAIILGLVAICVLVMSFVLPEWTGEYIYRYAGGILLLFGIVEILVFSLLWKRSSSRQGYRTCTPKTYVEKSDPSTPTTAV